MKSLAVRGLVALVSVVCGTVGGEVCAQGPIAWEAELLTEVKGTQVIEVPDASGGKVLELSEVDAMVKASVPVSEGEYLLTVRGYGPGAQRDALYVQVGNRQPERLAFIGGFGEESLSFLAAKAGTMTISITTDEVGVCVDRLVIDKGAANLESFEIAELTDRAAERDWLTRLLVSFDDDSSVNAIYARGIPYGVANNTTPERKGKFGSAVGFYNLGDPYGSISAVKHVEQARKCGVHYSAGSNLPTRQGTIEFWLRSRDGMNIWNDGRQHDVFHILPTATLPGEAPGFSIHLLKGANNMLELRVGGNLSGVEVSQLNSQAWHHIACSWDAANPPGRIWLTVDGVGTTRPCASELHPHSFLVLYLGNTMSFTENYPLDGALDDLKVSEWTLAERTVEGLAQCEQYAIDEELARQAEEGLRRWLGLVGGITATGSFAGWRQWPTLLPFAAGSYQRPTDPRIDDLKYGYPLRPAKELLQAYQVFGDYCFEEGARLLTERLLREQDPRGFFSPRYLITPSGPVGHSDYARIQDGHQTAPLTFLVYAYRVLRDERYLEAAKKVADFLLAAQNPNGSWSDSFDVKQGEGYTAGSEEGGGGSFNDGATSDAFCKLLLMYHVTRDEKYLEALVKAADWVISAEIKSKARGWAQQYKADNTPAWARRHEPPVICTRVFTSWVAPMMFDAYLLTGDMKYLNALRGTLKWLQEVKVERRAIHDQYGYLKNVAPDTPLWSFYYDPATGRPCYSTTLFGPLYEHHLDEREDVPVPRGFYKWEHYPVDGVADTLAKMDEGKYEPKVASLDLSREALANKRQAAARTCNRDSRRQEVRAALKEQRADGAWVSGHRPGYGAELGNRSYVLLNYLWDARFAAGKLPVEFVFRGAYDGRMGSLSHGGAWFAENWYDTPLKTAR